MVKTKEEMEAEEIEKMQEEARKKLRQNRRSFRRLAKSSKPQPVKYSKPMTEAVGFNFRTDKRCQRRSAASRGPQPNLSGSHPSNFPMTLRSGREIQPEVIGWPGKEEREGEERVEQVCRCGCVCGGSSKG